MARAKRTGFDRRVSVDGDGWETWATGDLVWRYRAGKGINLLMRKGNTEFGLVYMGSLKQAGDFAEGFYFAMDNGMAPPPA